MDDNPRGTAPIESALRQALDVVYRRRDDALIVCGLVVGVALLYTLSATPAYEARAQLLIETEAPNVVSFEEVLQQNRQSAEYYQTQYRILESRSLAKRALDAGGLWRHPALQPRQAAWYSPRHMARTAFAWLGGLFRRAPAATSLDGDSIAQARTIDAFLAGLTIAPVRNSRLVDVRYLSPDPGFAAQAANVLAKAYVDQSLEYRLTASQEASRWLEQQMGEQRKAVQDAELALQRYREDYDASSLQERQNIVIQRLADLNSALTRARTERIGKEASFLRLQEIRREGASLDAFPAVLANGLVQQLKGELAVLQRQESELSQQLGDRHPDMLRVRSGIQTAQAKLQAQIEQVVQSVENEYEAALSEERSLQRALEAQKGEAQALNRRAVDYGVLEQDAKANREVFDALMKRTRETDISGNLRTSNIRIVDGAEVPQAPSYPSRATHLLLGLAAGLVFGLAFVLVVDFFDSRIKTPSELKAALPLPYLGSIPITPASHGHLLVNNGVRQPFAESVRGLQSNILFAAPGQRRSIAVTSTAPGEGKTVVASNLALSLAMSGHRVLLIDADLRQPRQQDLFGAPLYPGLADVITRAARPSEAIRAVVDRLWLLPAGHLPATPPELLGAPIFAEMLNTFTDSFDWVILDSPPVTGMADAAQIAHVAGGVLFVVGAEMTTRAAARAALEQLDTARATYVGAVLNRLDPDGHPYYYYKRA